MDAKQSHQKKCGFDQPPVQDKNDLLEHLLRRRREEKNSLESWHENQLTLQIARRYCT